MSVYNPNQNHKQDLEHSKDQSARFEETYIREVRIQYHRTDKAVFAIRLAQDAHDFLTSILPDNSREHSVALYLNAAHEVICYSLISTGSAEFAPVSPRDIFQRALAAGAVALLFCHNHPSGHVKPSPDDYRVTARLKEVGELIGIKLLDHVIVAGDAFYSFQEKGEI